MQIKKAYIFLIICIEPIKTLKLIKPVDINIKANENKLIATEIACLNLLEVALLLWTFANSPRPFGF